MSTGGQSLPDGAKVILRGIVGSTVHGCSVSNQDDRDEMGICVEPSDYVIGLRHFETHVWRTQPEGFRSGPGDLDLTIHSLRKFARLAAKGNPSIHLLLFVPPEFTIECDNIGSILINKRSMFLSKHVIRAFLGYMQAQRQRLEGTRGQKRVTRPELVEQYGFDTKYAGHIIRLGYQGVEMADTGGLSLPMRDEDRQDVIDVRTGKWSINKVLIKAGELERKLKDAVDDSTLPDEPDWGEINDFLIWAHRYHWEGTL